MVEEEEEPRGEGGASAASAIARLIERATNSTAPEVDHRLLKAIKSSARSSDDAIRLAVRSLMAHMKKPHSQVRFLAVLIIDELFVRSKLFRSLFVLDLDQFLTLAVGFRRNMPLPPPASIAATLRKTSIELLERWNASFGIHYRQLRLGIDYLKNTLHLQFPNLPEAAARLQQERREREARTQEILLSKLESLKESLPSIKAGIQSTVDEVAECLEIVGSKEADFDPNIPAGGDEAVEFGSLELWQIRLDSLKEGERVQETGDNRPVFDALRESLKLLVSKHLVSVQEWISVLIRVDLVDNRFRDAALKEFIDFRNSIRSVRNRCSQLGCVVNDAHKQNEAMEDDEEGLWEEGKVEIYKPGPSGIDQSSAEKNLGTPSTSKGMDAVLERNRLVNTDVSGLNLERSRLMAEAPMLTWSSFLDNWGSNQDVLVNQRGLELEAHWGRVDYDAVIPAEKIAELNVHRSVYKEEPVDIQPCRAPLRKGGLCQRRDLRVCPFHGPIIPRDAEGNPIKQNELSDEESLKRCSSSTSMATKNEPKDAEKSLDIGEETLEKLAKTALKNVRDRDRDARLLKRAKLAKVREHNEEVLREAAIASTSYTSDAFGQPAPGSPRNGAGIKIKEPTLASMLKKKITSKDRLAQKLLNSRVRDAAVKEVSQGEDLKYREAFPNQW